MDAAPGLQTNMDLEYIVAKTPSSPSGKEGGRGARSGCGVRCKSEDPKWLLKLKFNITPKIAYKNDVPLKLKNKTYTFKHGYNKTIGNNVH